MTIECLSCGGPMRRDLRYTSFDVYRCADCSRRESAPAGYYREIDPEYDPGPVLCACDCGTEIDPGPGGGRPRKWVNDAHRKRASRRGPP